MNDLTSLGLHRCWKDIFVVNIISPESFLRIKRDKDEDFSNVTILDVTGRTGDVSFRIIDKFKKDNIEVLPNIIVVDSNSEMIEQGQLKSIEKGDCSIIWIKDDGEKLSQIPSNSVDVVAISFGIRNFTNIEKEFSKANNPLISSIYQLYSSIAIPSLGEFIAGDRESYNYLESIRKFPDAEKFAQLLINASFTDVKSSTMTFGVIAIHSGFKPANA
ncbi:ubiE/COQ5 methyltransferase family protein [Cryptosporidium meleagridis]|uniref:UbiE/COQ5 methyltransferase family protein n=1 Tax=Cryptosporidium meleagridis TaxID=93969 RepID=A0A2P4YWJ5_9CRYT|nr:ubiE/COQ5 methyltransferase family protein [Cryptosporidium meleagridis]